MDFINTTAESLRFTYTNFWDTLIAYLPNILGALFVLALGFLVAGLFHKLAENILKFFKIKELFDKFKFTELFQKAGVKFNIVSFLASFIYLFIVVIFASVTLQMLNLTQIADYFTRVVFYLPNVIVAVIILVIGLLIGGFVENLVKNTTKAANIASSDFLGRLAKWVILIFSFLAALTQLQIAADLVKILFSGLVVMLAVAGGLAFGLGGKDLARDILQKFKNK